LARLDDWKDGGGGEIECLRRTVCISEGDDEDADSEYPSEAEGNFKLLKKN